MAIYKLPKNHKTGMLMFSKLYLQDVLIVMAVFVILNSTDSLVHSSVQKWYYIIGMGLAIYMVIPSRNNPGKRNYHALYYSYKSDRSTYHALDSEKVLNDDLRGILKVDNEEKKETVVSEIAQPKALEVFLDDQRK